MTRAEISPIVLSALKRIAPEIDTSRLDTSANVRDQLDLDSMDFLNFVLALHDRFNVEIPETDYPQLYTVDGAVSYLAAKTLRA
jgi:acyl carrier protein